MSTVTSLPYPEQPHLRSRGFQVLSRLARHRETPGRHVADSSRPTQSQGEAPAEVYEPRHRADDPAGR